MKRWALLFLLLLTLPDLARAQLPANGNLTTQGTASGCTATSTACLLVTMPSAGAAALELSGTWSGTVSIYSAVSLDGVTKALLSTDATPVSSFTANGVWQFNTAGYRYVLVVFTTATSGTVAVKVTSTPASARAGGTGGAAGANTSLSNLTTTAINQDLLPDTPGGRSIGGSGNAWNILYALQVGDASNFVTGFFNAFNFNGPQLTLYGQAALSCTAPSGFQIGGLCILGPNSVPRLWNINSSAWRDLMSRDGGSFTPGDILSVGTNAPDATDSGKVLPSGAVVGISDTQTLTNKDLTSGTNTFPTFNQNTSGTAANLSGTPALPNGTTATTQSAGDSTTKLATDAFVAATLPTKDQLTGTNTSDYTNGGSTSFAAVDGTNLTKTRTVPVGSKWSVVVSGTAGNSIINDYVVIGLGSGSCSTILYNVAIQVAIANQVIPFALNWQVTGDGASHTILLCYKSVIGGTADVANNGGAFPVMNFSLESAN